jgi:sn-glycerol 3-phosphate transport system permease protein
MPASLRPRGPLALIGYGLLTLLSLVAIFPIYWMINTSLKPANEIVSPSLLPLRPTLEHYRFVLESIPIAAMLANTFAMAALVTLGQLLTALLAGFAFARWRFPGDRVLLLLFTFTWLVPPQVTMVPNYVLVAQLGWRNSLLGLVVPQIASAFAVLLLYQTMRSFPRDLIDAARIDGATSWTTLWRVVVPNIRAALASLAILLFISAWNEYFWPLLVTSSLERATVQIGLQMFLTAEGDLWGPLMAAATLVSLPILVIYLVLQRQVIDAFVKSGLR